MQAAAGLCGSHYMQAGPVRNGQIPTPELWSNSGFFGEFAGGVV